MKELLCQISDPIPLGEGAGVGTLKDGSESMALPERSSLYDLVDIGIKHTHAAVGALVRLRKELSLVKDVPVLIAIDQVSQISATSSLCNIRETCSCCLLQLLNNNLICFCYCSPV